MRRAVTSISRPTKFDLRTDQGFLEEIIDKVPDMVWIKDVDGVFLACNHMVEKLFNASKHRIIGKTDLDFVNPERAYAFRMQDRLAIRIDSTVAVKEWRVFAYDGSRRLYETVKSPFRDALGHVIGVIGIARDITDGHEAKVAQDSLDRALKLIGRCNQAMIHAASEEILSTQICQLAVDVGGYALAWVGVGQAEGAVGLLPVAWSIGGEIYLDRIRRELSDDELREGPARISFRTGTTVVNQDYSGEAGRHAVSRISREFGYSSCIAIPLRQRDEIFGVLTIYAGKANVFSADEIPLLEELAADLSFGIQVLRTRADHNRAKQRLEFLAHHDALTGTANRLFLRKRFEEMVEAPRSLCREATILLLDVDNFKAVNDRFGHDYGDKLLIEFARGFERQVGNCGVTCRYGSDEFVMLLFCDKGKAEAIKFARRLLTTFSQPLIVEGVQIDITFSIGLSRYPVDGEDLEMLIKHAGIALRCAKESGKNSLRVFDDTIRFDANEQIVLWAELNDAIQNSELVLHFQPKVDTISGLVVGAEALLRWQHPRRGIIGPATFIPIAEKSGLIIPVGEWVLRQTCRQVAKWIAVGLHIGSVSVNVSACQLRRGDFVETVRSALRDACIPPHHIELELTESAFLNEFDSGIKLLQELREMGVKLAIDDFGTGYSNLAYLKELRVDRLKMDRLFIRDIPHCADSVAIVKTIIQLGRNLDLFVTAEGVETPEQLDTLKALGCDEVQGYLIGKPLSADEFAAMCQKIDHS
jgi:diguanylate cyclase (GGDEF)-like protein/PAS domain S-box-containing protein